MPSSPISRRKAISSAIHASLAAAALPVATDAAAAVFRTGGPRFMMYVGTYTGPKSKGIYGFRFDPSNGSCTPLGVVAEIPSPSFLAIHPSKPLLYCVNEMDSFGGKPAGGVSAFRIDSTSGKLDLINQASSGGTGPCHLTVDRTGKCVLAANYGGGSIASYRIRPDGGLTGPVSFIQHTGSSINPARQKEPHAHSINVSPDNRFAFVADLGLDRILCYKLNPESAALQPHDIPQTSIAPGSGPRHFTFHPSGRFAYVINEMLCTITAFKYDAKKGALQEFQTISTLPSSQPLKPEYSTAEIVAHPSGKFLFGSNRGHDTIASFSISKEGLLTPLAHTSTQGRIPRNFALDPTGSFLFAENQSSDSIVQFSLDRKTGNLVPTSVKLEVGSPVCVRFAELS